MLRQLIGEFVSQPEARNELERGDSADVGVSFSHEFDTKIMSEEIYILVGIKLWAKAVDVDNRRTD